MLTPIYKYITSIYFLYTINTVYDPYDVALTHQ